MGRAGLLLALLAGCDGREVEEAGHSALKGDAGEEVDLAAHPPAVDDITVEIISDQRTDNAWLSVTYAEGAVDAESITLSLEGGEVTIADDGSKPDAKAGDGVFTGVITFDLADYVDRHAAYAEAAGALDDAQVGVFDGFTRLGAVDLDLDAVGPNLDGEPVEIDLSDPVGTTLTLFSGALPPMTATIDPEATLAVRSLGVVNDRSRTGYWHWDGSTCTQTGDPEGVWGFTYLMEQINGGGTTGIDTDDFIEEWLKQFNTVQTVNGQTVHIDHNGFSDLWKSIPFTSDDGDPQIFTDSLDLDELPVQLIAITNRLDVRDAVGYGGAEQFGELRFVFSLVDTTTCEPLMGTIILEFGVPVEDCAALQLYAQDWYDLDALTLGSATYNQALEDITESVVPAGLDVSKPNNSAINQIRTNELEFAWGHLQYPDNNWDLKEFVLPSDGAHLTMNTVAMTPDYIYELPDHSTGAQPIDDFIDTYSSDILSGTYTVDLTYPGTPDPFRGAYVPYGEHFPSPLNSNGRSREFDPWTQFPIGNWQLPVPMERLMYWGSDHVGSYEARHVFSINTCSGCHGHETIEPGSSVTGATADEPFLHIEMQGPGQQARFSRFLTGTADSCVTADGLVSPLGAEVCSSGCCPIGDPAFGDTVAQYHYDELERRAQDLEHLVLNDCSTLLGVDWLNDAITQAAH